jgi:hypothetical protein
MYANFLDVSVIFILLIGKNYLIGSSVEGREGA